MKSYIVFGCGKFGSSVAKTLSELGNEVMIVDINMDSIEEIADYVTTAIQCDVMDQNATSEMGLKNFDAAVVAIGTNFEAAIMSTVLAKEAGIEYIVAKAINNRQALILKKLGADKIIFPERDMGVRVKCIQLDGLHTTFSRLFNCRIFMSSYLDRQDFETTKC